MCVLRGAYSPFRCLVDSDISIASGMDLLDDVLAWLCGSSVIPQGRGTSTPQYHGELQAKAHSEDCETVERRVRPLRIHGNTTLLTYTKSALASSTRHTK